MKKGFFGGHSMTKMGPGILGRKVLTILEFLLK
jgi:hypothetical protein